MFGYSCSVLESGFWTGTEGALIPRGPGLRVDGRGVWESGRMCLEVHGVSKCGISWLMRPGKTCLEARSVSECV
jgi:hypothetical protein